MLTGCHRAPAPNTPAGAAGDWWIGHQSTAMLAARIGNLLANPPVHDLGASLDEGGACSGTPASAAMAASGESRRDSGHILTARFDPGAGIERRPFRSKLRPGRDQAYRRLRCLSASV